MVKSLLSVRVSYFSPSYKLSLPYPLHDIMISPSARPADGSDDTTSNTTSTSNTQHIPLSSSHSQQHEDQSVSFPEIYRKTLAAAPPHNYEKSDAVDSSFMEQWPSSSLPEVGEVEDDDTMGRTNGVDASSSSGPGSGDVLSDEDRERLGSIQRGENTAVVGWLKNLGNHNCRQLQHDHKGKSSSLRLYKHLYDPSC